MTKHDSFVYLKSPSPYDAIKHLFPRGLPMRDPFALASVKKPDGSKAALWTVDLDRLNPSQFEALAETIAQHNNVHTQEVIDDSIAHGGFAIDQDWVERLEVGAEGFQRMQEFIAFEQQNPDPNAPGALNAYQQFVTSQYQRWIDGDETPPPLPKTIEEVDPGLRTRELASAIERNRIQQRLQEKNYSVLDVLLGYANEDIASVMDEPGLATEILLDFPTFSLYRPPYGLPMRWQDEMGELPQAIEAYLRGILGESEPPTSEQIALIRKYLKHYINAPCWNTRGMEKEFSLLREKVDALFTAEDLSAWLEDCLEVGLDPL